MLSLPKLPVSEEKGLGEFAEVEKTIRKDTMSHSKAQLWTCLLCVWNLCFLFPSSSLAQIPEAAKVFIARHCLECHDQQSKSGGLDLSSLAINLEDAAIHQQWIRLHDRVRLGQMPPKESPRPDAQEADAFLRCSMKACWPMTGTFLGPAGAAFCDA